MMQFTVCRKCIKINLTFQRAPYRDTWQPAWLRTPPLEVPGCTAWVRCYPYVIPSIRIPAETDSTFHLYAFLFHHPAMNKKMSSSNFFMLKLTHHSPVIPHGNKDPDYRWFKWWLVTGLAQRYYLNQWWHIGNWTLSLEQIWILNQNIKIPCHKNASENFFLHNGGHFFQVSIC